MTRSKELRRVERAIEHGDAVELRWAQHFCEDRLRHIPRERDRSYWRKVLKRVLDAQPASQIELDAAIDTAERLLRAGHPAVEEDADPKWQAIIAVGNFIDRAPERLWPFILKWGGSDDEDTRTATATVLLEHLLEYHFDLYVDRVAHAIEADSNFADTFTRCWRLGQADDPPNAVRFDALMAAARERTRAGSDDEP